MMKQEGKVMLVVNTNKVMSENTRQSMKDACRRWDCDFMEITEHTSPWHHATLKLKAFDFCPQYRILIIDSDTCIRSDAPNLFNLTSAEEFYAVKNQQPHYPPAYNQNVAIADRDIRKVLAQKQVNATLDIAHVSQNFFNSGVVMVSRKHEEVLALAYYLFLGVHGLQWWDQIPLNIAAHTILGGYNDLGVSWNYQFPQNVRTMTQHIYHFAGNPNRYDILKTINWITNSSEVPNREELHNLINRLQLKVGIEIGTQQGKYAKYLLEKTNLEMLHLVDAWQYIEGYRDIANVQNPQHEKNLQETVRNVSPFPGRYDIIKKFSVDAAKEFADESLDFVYIDADHSYKGTMDDLKAWYPKVRTGGLLAGHDFLDGENICGSNFGVRSAVLEFIQGTRHALHVTAGAWPTWFMEKKEG